MSTHTGFTITDKLDGLLTMARLAHLLCRREGWLSERGKPFTAAHHEVRGLIRRLVEETGTSADVLAYALAHGEDELLCLDAAGRLFRDGEARAALRVLAEAIKHGVSEENEPHLRGLAGGIAMDAIHDGSALGAQIQASLDDETRAKLEALKDLDVEDEEHDDAESDVGCAIGWLLMDQAESWPLGGDSISDSEPAAT